MESITHALSGVVVSTLGIKQRFGSSGVFFFVLATVFPDIDFIFGLFTRSIYVRFHRGFTHSFIWLPLFSLFLCFIFQFFTTKINFKSLYLICFLGMTTHIMFDLLNSYGTLIFLPFTSKQYSLDLDIILDAFFILPLFLGVVALWLFPASQRKIGAIVIFILVLGVFLRLSQKQKAMNLVGDPANPAPACRGWAKAVTRKVEPDRKINIFPSGINAIYNPFLWRVAVLCGENYNVFDIDTLKSKFSPLEQVPYPREQLAKFTSKSKALRHFLNWARFPFGRIEESGEQIIIKLSDLRFRHSHLISDPLKRREEKEKFVLISQLSKDGNVISEKFIFQGQE